MMTSLRLILLLAALIPGLCYAQGYPSRPITLVVPYSPGTGIDIIARTVGPKISERWHQPVVVENKPGASGDVDRRKKFIAQTGIKAD